MKRLVRTLEVAILITALPVPVFARGPNYLIESICKVTVSGT